MGEEVFALSTADEQLSYMADTGRTASLLMEKWSRRPTMDRRTGKITVTDWLGTDKVGRWDVPEIKTEYGKLQIAMILEHQSRVNGALVQASDPTVTGDLALPTRYSLPIVRRVYAQMLQADWQVTQAMPGPLAYVFWLDFLRTDTNRNILSVSYNEWLKGENQVPLSGRMQMTRAQVTAVKQLLGLTWSLEAEEDGRAQLGIDVEQELITAFSEDMGRNLLARSLQAIYLASTTGTAQGASLVAPWAGPNTQHQFGAIGSLLISDYKQSVFSTLVNADTDFQRANRNVSDGIIAGYGLAGFLQKINTATGATGPDSSNQNFLGVSDYGTFAGRWKVQGTDMLPDTVGFVYKRNPAPIQAGHIYCPYVPIQVMPAVYAEYDTTSGAYINTDKYTRNIRERSGYITTKPYGFQPILAPATGLAQY